MSLIHVIVICYRYLLFIYSCRSSVICCLSSCRSPVICYCHLLFIYSCRSSVICNRYLFFLSTVLDHLLSVTVICFFIYNCRSPYKTSCSLSACCRYLFFFQRFERKSSETMIILNQMHFAGDVIRKNNRFPKQHFNGKLKTGKCLQHKFRKRSKDNLKESLKAFHVDVHGWDEPRLIRENIGA